MSSQRDFFELLKRRTPCECEICRYGRHIRAVKERGNVEEMRQLIEELSENLWNTGEELEMYKDKFATRQPRRNG